MGETPGYEPLEHMSESERLVLQVMTAMMHGNGEMAKALIKRASDLEDFTISLANFAYGHYIVLAKAEGKDPRVRWQEECARFARRYD